MDLWTFPRTVEKWRKGSRGRNKITLVKVESAEWPAEEIVKKAVAETSLEHRYVYS